MEKIRDSVFETNSSSTHSISFGTGVEICDALPISSDGVFRVYDGDFGWEVETYSDSVTKASYALTWATTYGDASNLDMLMNALKLELGVDAEIEFVCCGGSIDHQSSDTAAVVFESAKILRNFIFNTKVKLHTDNDNH